MKMIYEDLEYYIFAFDKDDFLTDFIYKKDIDGAKEYAEQLKKEFDDVYIQEKKLYKVT